MILDHMGGFDRFLRCNLLDELNKSSIKNNRCLEIFTEYIIGPQIATQYSNLDLKFDVDLWIRENNIKQFFNYQTHPELQFSNFLCSFNGSSHVSRQLLVAILKKFGFFCPDYSSKNFTFSEEMLSGHVTNYVQGKDTFYHKFFLLGNSKFYDTIYTSEYNRFDHIKNIYALEKSLTQSFVHIVSETLATYYYPFVTEKFLYSVVTRGLFLSYAQPGWHDHLEKYHGFRKYDKIFDYHFDTIQDPVERLVELITMISKFSFLSSDDWRDLYLLQLDEIEYNHEHYYSGAHLKNLKESTWD